MRVATKKKKNIFEIKFTNMGKNRVKRKMLKLEGTEHEKFSIRMKRQKDRKNSSA